MFLACLIAALCTTAPVELFIYWQPHLRGQEGFPIHENMPDNQQPMFSQVRQKLLERGLDIQSWDLTQHRDAMLSWAMVHSWKDFWTWAFPPKIKPHGKWVFCSLGPDVKQYDFSRMPKEQLVLVLWEPPTVEPEGYEPLFLQHFGKVLTWDDDLVDNVRFFKFCYPEVKPLSVEVVPFAQKKFCVLLGTRRGSNHPKELYKAREKVIEFFEKKPVGEFDLYGRNWQRKRYKTWRGRVDDKLGTLKQYKFSICYENMGEVKGYITEKIFDCFAAGNVPVYLGASNVTDFIPKECFIDRRDFGSEQELYEFLQGMNEETYNGYLRSVKEFLQSEKAQRFSAGRFAEDFARVIF